MIQFINGLGVTGKYKAKSLDDAVEAIIIPIHRILMVEGVTHAFVRNRFRYEGDDEDEGAEDEWTAIQWDGTSENYLAFLRHSRQEVMMAISYLNQNPKRTTCYIDDHSCKDMG